MCVVPRRSAAWPDALPCAGHARATAPLSPRMERDRCRQRGRPRASGRGAGPAEPGRCLGGGGARRLTARSSHSRNFGGRCSRENFITEVDRGPRSVPGHGPNTHRPRHAYRAAYAHRSSAPPGAAAWGTVPIFIRGRLMPWRLGGRGGESMCRSERAARHPLLRGLKQHLLRLHLQPDVHLEWQASHARGS